MSEQLSVEIKALPGIVKYKNVLDRVRYLKAKVHGKWIRKEDLRSRRDFVRFARAHRVTAREGTVSFTPGLNLIEEVDGRFAATEFLRRLWELDDPQSGMEYLYAVAIKNVPHLRSLFDLLYMDEVEFTWPRRKKALRLRSALEKDEAHALYPSGMIVELKEAIVDRIKQDASRYFLAVTGYQSEVEPKIARVVWNRRTPSALANMSGLNTTHLCARFFHYQDHEGQVRVRLLKDKVDSSIMYEILGNVYTMIRQPTIDEALLEAYDSVTRGSVWVPVRNLRFGLQNKGVVDFASVEREILDSPRDDQDGFIFRGKLRIETKEGVEGAEGLGGLARFAFVRISKVRREPD